MNVPFVLILNRMLRSTNNLSKDMKQFLFTKFSLFAVFLLWSMTLSAATLVVTNSNDNGAGSLRAQINAASDGDIIIFDASTDGDDIDLASEITIGVSIRIVGNGRANTMIDGNQAGRIFNITNAGTVRISGVRLMNGLAVSGGAIFNSGSDIQIDDCMLVNNEATGDAAIEGGGAIYNTDGGGIAIAGNSRFSNNTASGAAGSGGAIFNYTNAALNIRSSSFDGNDASRAGGAIEERDGRTLHIRDTDFTGNSTGAAPGNGGAIHITGPSDADIVGGIFDSNTAAREGGAIWNGDGTMKAIGLTVINNTASGDAADDGGGGFFNQGGILIIRDSEISGNVADGAAGSGGGIFNNENTTLNLRNTEVANNTANRAGGGIETIGGTSVRLVEVTLNDNVVNNSPGNGGGLHVTSDGNVQISGGTVSNNTAGSEGGGLWNGTGKMAVRGVTIENNIASGDAADNGGGGIFQLPGGAMVISDCTISNNEANGTAGSGGGILNLGELRILNSIISDNTSNRAGGGMEMTPGSAAQVRDTDFTGNSTGAAPGNGGAIHITGDADISIDGGLFDNNTAALEGGGLWNGAGTMTVRGATITNNTASGDDADTGGGGVFNQAGTINITDSEISGNVADGISGSGGGILNNENTILNVSRTLISGNSSSRAGGGIETLAGTVVKLKDVNLDNNSTAANPGNGGGMHVTGAATVEVSGGTVNGNFAATEGGGLWNHIGTMSVAGVTIDNNIAAGDAADNGGGGLFQLPGGSMTVFHNTVISNNQATGTAGSGGGILNLGTLKLLGSTVSNNTSNRAGGGLEATAGSFTTVTNTDFIDNSTGDAPGNGGAIHITGNADMDISGGTYEGNTAAREGGAIWNGAGTMNVNRIVVRNNTASGDAADDGGGGFFNQAGILNIRNSEIADNIADGASGSGGGIFNNENTTLNVRNSSITGNTASRAGGGIETIAGTTVNLLDIDLSSNSTAAAPGNGGGLHVTSDGNVTIFGGTVNNNFAASEGGGLWNGTGTMNVTGTTIDGNTADGDAADNGGGGLFQLPGGTLIVKNAIITNNDATGASGSGGGILNTSVLEVSNTMISGNSASRAGGGIEGTDGSTATLDRVRLTNNSTAAAPGNGGGVHITAAGDMDITNSVVSGNTASNEGGGLWNGAGTMNVLRTTVDNNDAPEGGGIFNNGGTVNLSISTISTNTNDGLFNQGTFNVEATTIALSDVGVVQETGAITFSSSIIADNTTNFILNAGTINSDDYNLVGADAGNVFPAQANDIEGADPMLGPLQDNGGLTETHEVLCGSPAINSGNPANRQRDQRGERVAFGQRDIGSYEQQADCSTANNGGIEGRSEAVEIVSRALMIHPNPTRGLTTLQLPISEEQISIRIIESASGKLLKVIENTNGVQQLDLSNYADGLYIIQVVMGTEVSSHKLSLVK